jgi:lactate dehydrogenase-like 2-hydroxyacid dehydrogenase
MKLVVLNAKNRYRQEDLEKLDNSNAIFYEQKGNKLEDIKELVSGEDVILGIQPGFIDRGWAGVTWEKINKYKNIKGLCLSTTAYGWVPFKKLAEKNIPVTNIPGKSTDAVAEYYVFLMIALLRKLPAIIKKEWKYESGPEALGTNAKGLTVGIVGLGSIGSRVADLCNGFQMKVTYWNRSSKESSYLKKSLEDLCKESDVLFLTTIADDSTRGLITKKMIDSMKKNAIILSPIEGYVYNQEYVMDKVAQGDLGGLGYESDDENIVQSCGNVFPAPEIGYYTKQTLDNESRIMTESMLSILENKPQNVVNL